MKKLLFQSDDYGLTDSVADGIIKGIELGIIRNTGLFVNMPSSSRSAEKIKNRKDVCVGIDINLVAGNPVTDPKQIPSLVDEKGHFISSSRRMKEGKILGVQGFEIIFENDPYDYEETLLETENQVKRFIELMGRKPAYFHGHSIGTPNTAKAAREVAKKYGILMTTDVMKCDAVYSIPCDWTPKPFPIEKQMATDVEANFLKSLENSLDHEIGYFICHCGFVEEDLFRETSYTLIRNKDLYAACSPKVRQFLDEHEIELITYEDLKEIVIC
ncbi:MAG: ChbG/HpnK family deacetylase [Traorella sp.]